MDWSGAGILWVQVVKRKRDKMESSPVFGAIKYEKGFDMIFD